MDALTSLIVFLLRLRIAIRAFHRCPGRVAWVAHQKHLGAIARN